VTPYWVVVLLLMLGLYVAIAHGNFLKKFVGLTIFQTGVILFFVLLAAKRGATLPVVAGAAVDARHYVNPLPHALMLTAIVVMVATAGVALAILIRLHAAYGTVEEERLVEQTGAGREAG
jgi:multicomponent Na+:H+ antiporter subunit C